MRILLILLYFVVTAPIIAGDVNDAGKTVSIEFFYQPGCKKCHRIKTLLLPELADVCKGKYQLQMFSTGDKENYIKLLAVMERLKVNSNATAYMIINSRIMLTGGDIEKKLIDVVKEEYASVNAYVDKNTGQADSSSGVLQRRANSFTIGTIIIAGLIDGVNPCVFSTLIFFISLLSVAKVKKQKMLWVGLFYCISCFVTYLAIGFGVFSCLKALSEFNTVQQIINYLMIAVLLIFAVISFSDCFRYRASGKAQSVSLKLPSGISKLIHKIMKEGLSYKAILPAVFLVGILVTILESVCTGQVYIPTLVLMAKDTAGAKWFTLLLLYNLMFIIPLAIIFIAFYKGVNTPRLIKWSKKNVVFSKFSLGCFFILLAIIMQFL
jgi:cytochrome c biogenesis protein CcdA